MPCSFISSFTSSFIPCAVAFDTTPTILTLCPTCSSSLTLSLLSSQVPPPFAAKLYSLASSPSWRQPVSVRVFLWVVLVLSPAVAIPAAPANMNNAIIHATILRFIFGLPKQIETCLQVGMVRLKYLGTTGQTCTLFENNLASKKLARLEKPEIAGNRTEERDSIASERSVAHDDARCLPRCGSSHRVALLTAVGTRVTAFNCSSSVSTPCQRTWFFFVSIGRERS